MERRPLGKTGEELSVIGFGAIALVGMEPGDVETLVGEAIDCGVNYFDVAPSYGPDADAERRLGPALESRRDGLFLACKTVKRDREGAGEELRASLKRLRTDHVDLYQLHAITTPEEVRQALGPGGAMEAFLQAREEGLIRHIGFSAHSVEAALLALDQFPFDTALFPVNYVVYEQSAFGPQIIAKAMQTGTARLAIKAMARTRWPDKEQHDFPFCWYEPITDPYFAGLALRFTLSQAITASIAPGDARLIRMTLALSENIQPLSREELDELQAFAAPLEPIFPI